MRCYAMRDAQRVSHVTRNAGAEFQQLAPGEYVLTIVANFEVSGTDRDAVCATRDDGCMM